ncbi:hypothetical protein [Radiobacillus sp. PE A8.2]|uniref:hypothetical protein n=1 Tax=Radiobacillus sp. PE A8.2 TaxID=3380349 RepID=UPI00389082DD
MKDINFLVLHSDLPTAYLFGEVIRKEGYLNVIYSDSIEDVDKNRKVDILLVDASFNNELQSPVEQSNVKKTILIYDSPLQSYNLRNFDTKIYYPLLNISEIREVVYEQVKSIS